MNWLIQKMDKWATNKQREEMVNFIALLRSMDGSELGHAVAIATHARHKLETTGHHPMDPIVYTSINPGFPLFLSRVTNEFKKKRQDQDAAAYMIWTHTARAGVRLELRSLGRELWRELSRGFPHVEESAHSFFLLSGIRLNISFAQQFPSGLTPEPM
jgi:hypothetical protein